MAWHSQVSTWTANNRYPGIFRSLQAWTEQKPGTGMAGSRLKILSFGCSSGSEISSLRSYFPEALLYGCDVNPGALRQASDALLMDEAVLFESSPENIAAHGPFDIILAMSVLCRFPDSMKRGLNDFSRVYPFQDFADMVASLSQNLRHGGMLCLYNTNYDFMDTPTAADFRPLISPLVASNGFVDKFDARGQRLTTCDRVGPYYVHGLSSASAGNNAIDFTYCMFEKDGSAREPLHLFADAAPVRPPGEPEFYRFGPDLVRCARDRQVATALGYWLIGTGEDRSVVKAWHRTTQKGAIERLPASRSLASPDAAKALSTLQGYYLSHLPPESTWLVRLRQARFFGERLLAQVRGI